MKKFLLLPLIITALVLPGFAEPRSEAKPQSEAVQPSQEPKFIEEILSGYNEGKYDSFLKQMDQNYEDASSRWEHNGILEERKKLSSIAQDFDSPKKDAFKQKIAALHEHENRELVDLCISEPTCSLTRNVKDMVFFTPSQQEQDSLEYLASLNLKFKGDGKTPVENKLIDIDTEFWIKMLSLDVLLTQNKIDQSTYLKQRAVLQLEKLKKMKLATAEQDVDPKIKEYIETAQSIYPKVQASSIIRKYLHDLAVGNVQPLTPTQEKMKAIVVKYHEKQQELVKEYFPADQN